MRLAKNHIRLYIYLSALSIIVILTLFLTLNFAHQIYQEYENKISQTTKIILMEKKRFMRNAIDQTIQNSEMERTMLNQTKGSSDFAQEQIEENLQHHIATNIRNIRLIDNGYIWVNQVVNYDGGQKYAL